MAEGNFVGLMSGHDFSAMPAEELALNSTSISRMIKKQRNERLHKEGVGVQNQNRKGLPSLISFWKGQDTRL